MECHRCVRPIQIGNDDYVENEQENRSHNQNIYIYALHTVPMFQCSMAYSMGYSSVMGYSNFQT